MNTAVVSLNAAVRQMTEMFRWPKCRSKKKPGCKYLRLLGMPIAKLALHCICVFSICHQ